MATLTMADRSAASLDEAGRAVCCMASRLSGILVGEVRSAAAFGTKVNPVIAPPALRLTSAVACCHQGLLAVAKRTHLLPERTTDLTARADEQLGQAGSFELARLLRMACTCGLPGSLEFWNRTAAFCAAAGGAPTIHFR